MSDHLLNLQEFYLFTFVSTSHALQGERILKAQQAEFIMIPTLREISASCGLSIKIRPENLAQYRQIFLDHRVKAENYYHVRKDGKQYMIKAFPFNTKEQ
ncbi:MAG TPA: DUF3343 domain-containing protein [Syntrophomonas sp.]|nr:DUF3343 domain-containing protein [Syntrophomonas sp.]HRW12993.1 DUF3343 domain-containing protein [Syntrophomonas sp.]